jgi:ribonuclease H / adenosylcobalamin/alpha-ribazole phosphatase
LEATLFFDGGSRGNPGHAGFGCCLISKEGRVLWQHGDYIGVATCNDAEWRGVLAGLQAAIGLGVGTLQIRGDSGLVINQLTGKYRCKKSRMAAYRDHAFTLMQQIGPRGSTITITHVPRRLNSLADKLANRAMDMMGPVGDPMPGLSDDGAGKADKISPADIEVLRQAVDVLDKLQRMGYLEQIPGDIPPLIPARSATPA